MRCFDALFGLCWLMIFSDLRNYFRSEKLFADRHMDPRETPQTHPRRELRWLSTRSSPAP